MSQLTKLKEDLIAYLAQCSGLEEVTLTSEFPARVKPNPLGRPIIGVGFESLAVEKSGFSDYLGTLEGDSVGGQKIAVTLRLDIVVPLGRDGGGCHSLFESLCQALLVTDNPFGVTQITCKEISFDKEAGGFALTALAQLSTLLTTRYTQHDFTDFVVTVTEKGDATLATD